MSEDGVYAWTCRQCAFFRPSEETAKAPNPPGKCVRFPPEPVVRAAEWWTEARPVKVITTVVYQQPQTHSDDTCGEGKLP